MKLPAGRTARVDVLLDGSLSSTGGGVRSSCTLIRADLIVPGNGPAFRPSAATPR